MITGNGAHFVLASVRQGFLICPRWCPVRGVRDGEIMSAHWQAAAQSMVELDWQRYFGERGEREVLDTTSDAAKAPFSVLRIVSTGCCEPGDPHLICI